MAPVCLAFLVACGGDNTAANGGKSGNHAGGSGGSTQAGTGGSGGSTQAGTGGSGGGGGSGGTAGVGGGGGAAPGGNAIKVIFVIAMENHDSVQIYGDTTDAPYLNNTLLPQAGKASNFNDELPELMSEPHYLWMEGGTNAYADHTFTTDNAPSAANSTSATAHLVTQIENAKTGISWMSYQEGIDAATGACPIVASKLYAPKHDPFIFFKDVAGDPPSKTNPRCVAHHKDLTALAADLAAKKVATYNFITPNLCNDMHGDPACPNPNQIQTGDTWLKDNLPPLIAYANANAGVIFITFDEGDNTQKMPFIVLGPHVKKGYTSTVSYTHSSQVKSIEEILGVPVLPNVEGATDLKDFFEPGFFP